tara:strand:- start:20 stop:823 length:804 start_codon:yes stop_codon:yes gene_type:complete
MFNFLHNFVPQSILFQAGFLTIHWYGLFVVSGIIAGLVIVLKLAKQKGIESDEVYNLGFYVVISAIVGSRVYAVFLDLPFYLQNPFEIVAVWHGGLAIHGGVIGGVLAGLIYTIRKKQSFWSWADIIAPALPLGQAIGRWGNYFNQELFGTPTSLPWGIPIELQNRPIEFLSSQYFHPTFLYESLLNLINFAILFLLIGKREKLGLKSSGSIFLIYLINYSVIRILMENLRTDATPEVWGLRLPVLISLLVIGASLIFIVQRLKSSK